MATNHTQTYQLSQWLPADQVRRTDFNEDNAKIDAVLAGLAGGKADAEALTALAGTVSGLSSTVTGHTAQLSQKGNCQIDQTSYSGSGQAGAGTALSFTFSGTPILVFVMKVGGTEPQILMNGIARGYGDLAVSWGQNSVSWYSPSSASNQMNERGAVYQVYALLRC